MSKRFETSRLCRSTHDLGTHSRTVTAAVRAAIDGLEADVDFYAAYQLCTVLMNIIRVKRDEIEERAEAAGRKP